MRGYSEFLDRLGLSSDEDVPFAKELYVLQADRFDLLEGAEEDGDIDFTLSRGDVSAKKLVDMHPRLAERRERDGLLFAVHPKRDGDAPAGEICVPIANCRDPDFLALFPPALTLLSDYGEDSLYVARMPERGFEEFLIPKLNLQYGDFSITQPDVEYLLAGLGAEAGGLNVTGHDMAAFDDFVRWVAKDVAGGAEYCNAGISDEAFRRFAAVGNDVLYSRGLRGPGASRYDGRVTKDHALIAALDAMMSKRRPLGELRAFVERVFGEESANYWMDLYMYTIDLDRFADGDDEDDGIAI